MSITLAQIAKDSNVSVSLVSRLLRNDPKLRVSESTRRRVLAVRDRLAWRQLETSQANVSLNGTIMVPLSLLGTKGAGAGEPEPFTMQLLRGFEEALGKHDLTLGVTFIDDDGLQKKIEDWIAQDHFRGVFILGRKALPGPVADLLGAKRVPHVLFQRSDPHTELNTVTPHDSVGFRQAVAALAERGHRCIGYVGPRRIKFGHFLNALVRQGLPIELEQFCELPFDRDGSNDWMAVTAEHFPGWLRAHPQVTAVVTESDPIALAVMECAEKAGMEVGRDLSVIGYGGLASAIDTRGYASRLSTIDEGTQRIGAICGELLIEQIRLPGWRIRHELLPVTLRLRDSVGLAGSGRQAGVAGACAK